MTRRPLEQQGRFFLVALAGYFTLHVFLRVIISPSLDYDEAEQALLGQWLLPGYTEQPPLYTWIQYLLFLVFGKSVFAISLLKNTLLLLTYLFVFLVAQRVMTSQRLAMLATLSLLLIPQIGWESQRDMTHTTLAVLAAAVTLWQVLRLLERQSLGNYLLLGVILAVGILSKANYLLFAGALLLTLGSFTEGRRVMFHRYMLLALALAIALPSGYLLWMTDNRDIVFSATHKFKRATEAFWYKGPSSLVTKIFFFLTPLWLILLLLFPQGFRRSTHTAAVLPQRLLQRLLLFLAIALLVVVLAGKVTYVKDRWLQPLLFIVPIVFFARLDQQVVNERRYLLFFRVVGVAALAIYAAFTLRVIAASHSGSFCRLNYPFAAFAVDLRNLGFDQGILVSDDRFLAGNLHLQFPKSPAVIPGYRLEEQLDFRPHEQLAVIWHAAQSPTLPDNLREFLAGSLALGADEAKIHVLSQPYLFGRGETIALAVLLLPLPTPHGDLPP
jgi:lipopolysaccharide core galacturonosyltransferase RgtB